MTTATLTAAEFNAIRVTDIAGGKGRFAGCQTVGEMKDLLRKGETIANFKYSQGWQIEVRTIRHQRMVRVACAQPVE